MSTPRDYSPLIPQEPRQVQGRTAKRNIETERRRHLRVRAMRTFYGTPFSTLAALRIISGGRKVNERTVRRWYEIAGAYPEAADKETLIEFLPRHTDVIQTLQPV